MSSEDGARSQGSGIVQATIQDGSIGLLFEFNASYRLSIISAVLVGGFGRAGAAIFGGTDSAARWLTGRYLVPHALQLNHAGGPLNQGPDSGRQPGDCTMLHPPMS